MLKSEVVRRINPVDPGAPQKWKLSLQGKFPTIKGVQRNATKKSESVTEAIDVICGAKVHASS